MNPDDGLSARIPPRRADLRRRRFGLLASWYGQERAELEIAAHTAQPRRIGDLIDVELARIRRPEQGQLIKLRTVWPQIVGGNFARFTEPSVLRDGVLTIKVRHSALLMELQESRDLLRQRVNTQLGGEVCSSVRLTVG